MMNCFLVFFWFFAGLDGVGLGLALHHKALGK